MTVQGGQGHESAIRTGKGGGCFAIVLGIGLATVGVLLCFTVVGAIIGVPLAIIGGMIAGRAYGKSR